MTDTRWFRTPGGNLFHATQGEHAKCSRRYSSGIVLKRTAADLPASANLCPDCTALLDAEAIATAHLFDDWDGDGTRLELIDNADSISLQVSLTGNSSVQLALHVRIKPDDLDRLEDWIRRVRSERGI